MNFKDLYKVDALGKQVSNYPNHGDAAISLTNDLYKAGLDDDDEVFTYLRSLRNRYKVVLHDDGFMSKLPKIVLA